MVDSIPENDTRSRMLKSTELISDVTKQCWNIKYLMLIRVSLSSKHQIPVAQNVVPLTHISHRWYWMLNTFVLGVSFIRLNIIRAQYCGMLIFSLIDNKLKMCALAYSTRYVYIMCVYLVKLVNWNEKLKFIYFRCGVCVWIFPATPVHCSSVPSIFKMV